MPLQASIFIYGIIIKEDFFAEVIPMAEKHNVEWKEVWKDEYLNWICGFANAQGGTIYIGIDDSGNISGLKNSKKLLEDIPNKIKNAMGIIPNINLEESEKGEYI